jgi:glutamate formiminotransferase
MIRRNAFVRLLPTSGPGVPHRTAGGCCVGARPALVAYNIYLAEPDLQLAKQIARNIRSPSVLALGLAVGDDVQVSCNLVAPWNVRPDQVTDAVAAFAAVGRTELVGLLPEAVLDNVPKARWIELDLAPERTIEARLPS